MTTQGAGEYAITAGQARILATLALDAEATAAQVARRAWPDSPGWGKRSRRHSTPAGGAMGVGLPMLAGRVLGRLALRGLVRGHHRMGSYTGWHLTSSGLDALHIYRAQQAAKAARR